MSTIIVCGGRNFIDRKFLNTKLTEFHTGPLGPVTLLVHGAQRGADTMADDWAKANGVPSYGEEANWVKYGNAAGPIRNGEMLKKHYPDFVLAFPGNNGTRNMIAQAEAAGIKVLKMATAKPAQAGAFA